MPRVARNKGVNSTYHIVERGNDRRAIFLSPDDKLRFLQTLGKVQSRFNFPIYSYCLMDNHIHLLLYDNGNDISTIMKSLNDSYVYYFNRRYQKSGHLFQDRFKSELVEDDRYLLAVSRYIHQNPVKARMVEHAGDYRWSSYGVYSGQVQEDIILLDTSKILTLFSNVEHISIREYISFVNSFQEIEEDFLDVDEVIGNEFLGMPDYYYGMPAAQSRIEELIKKEGLDMDEVLKQKEMRNALIREIRTHSSLTLKEIGILFGGISESRISRILSQSQ